MSATRRPFSPIRRKLAKARSWLADHDERWTFTFLYIGLAVVLSLLISLFWLVAVVAVHGLIEYWALGRQGSRDQRLARVLWHVKLDIALVLFALALAVYIDVLFGLAGLSAAARTGAQATARFIAWQRAIRGVLLTVDDAALVARSMIGNATRSGADQSAIQAPAGLPWQGRWGAGDWISVCLGAVSAGMLLAAPWLTGQEAMEVIALLASELHPWP